MIYECYIDIPGGGGIGIITASLELALLWLRNHPGAVMEVTAPSTYPPNKKE